MNTESGAERMNADARTVVVLGAGPCGLSAARRIAEKGGTPIVLEKQSLIGGLAATVRVKDYMLDYGPHTFHLKPSPITELFEEKVGARSVRTTRNVELQIAGRRLPYPLKPVDAFLHFNPILSAKIILSYMYTKLFRRNLDPTESFESFGIRNFGEVLYRLAFGDYSEKVWGHEGSRLSSKLAKQKLQSLDFRKLLLSTFHLLKGSTARELGLDTHTAYDAYPEEGIGRFFEMLSGDIQRDGGQVVTGANPLRLETDAANRVVAVIYEKDGQEHRVACDGVVSSIPLSELSRIASSGCSDGLQEHANSLQYRDLIEIYLVLDRSYFSEAHWIYLVDPIFRTSRLSEQKNLNERSCPKDRTIVSFDLTCNKNDYLWDAQDAFLINLAMEDLKGLGVQPRTIIDGIVMRAENVYPIYLKGFEGEMQVVLGELASIENLYSTGRQGLYLNNDMHDSMEMGYLAADALLNDVAPPEWYSVMRESYIRERLEGVKRDPIDFSHEKKG